MTKIGLEIHGYLNTKEKLFCKCKAIHGKKYIKPNTSICPICIGSPGAKPMLTNKSATNKVIQIALILGCKINEKLIWQRKHYDWPDLPKGYQNTISGSYAIPVGKNGKFLGIKITECHLEEDPASWNPTTGEIDYNKSGSPLIEIVTEPDFTNSEQVIEWLKQLTTTLGYIKAIDKNSGIKADINVSTTGKRVEIKNINSLRNIKSAIEYEIKRQKKEIPKIQETRMFDENKGITIKMRTKEETEDYRFITEPDLPIVKIEKSRVKKLRENLPETPHEKLKKLIKKHKIEKHHAEILTKKLEIVEFFEKVITKIKPRLAIHWITIELLRVLNYAKKEMEDVNIDPYHFIELMDFVGAGKITELKAKEILNEFIPNSFSPKKRVQKHSRISESNIIEIYVKQAIKENAKAVEDYKLGKNESLNFLIGQVMKISNKRADFKAVRKVFEKLLK
tara:strand:- start:8933 stop:10285 length:1353 start_codon:yes stop_codon:yes gene_type:complete